VTGPEHYREAERLLAFVENHEGSPLIDPGLTAVAQVHATLALAAAAGLNDAEQGLSGTELTAWHEAAGTRANAQ